VVYTIEDVVKEIRDVKTRESLNVTLYTLKFKEPSTDAIRFGENEFDFVCFLFIENSDIFSVEFCKENWRLCIFVCSRSSAISIDLSTL